MTKLDVLNEIASAITGTTVAATDIKSAIDIIAAKGKGSAVSSETIAEALSVCDTYIENIIGSDVVVEANKAVTITTNTETEITPTSGSDAMAKVTVTTNIPVPTIEANKTITISNTGTVEITPTSGSDAMAKVTATVNVPTTSVTPPAWYTDGADSIPPSESQIAMADLSQAQTYQTETLTGDGESSINGWASEHSYTITSLTWLWNSNGIMILGYEYGATVEP